MEARKTEHVTALTGLRGLAFTFIFYAHITQVFDFSFKNSGKLGVVIFFTLSGFLLCRNLVLKLSERDLIGQTLLSYAFRRLIRIYPLYVLVLLAVWLTQIMPFTFEQLKQHVLLKSGELHFWAIPVEMQLYLFIPLIAWLFIFVLRQRLTLFLGSFLILLTIYSLVFPTIGRLSDTPLTNDISVWLYLPILLIGAGAGIVSTHYQSVRPAIGTIVGLVGLAFLTLTLFIPALQIQNEVYDRQFFWVVTGGALASAGVMFSFITSTTMLEKVFASKVLNRLGLISYSGYLWHLLVLMYFYFRPGKFDTAVAIIIAIVATLVLSGMSYWLVERPLSYVREFGDLRPSRWAMLLRQHRS